ncbi:MAG TPA: hypothetical protein VL527_03430 [Dongiaceae bacterium]|nr:hypothetical protein [Dongiaceae bacterium]
MPHYWASFVELLRAPFSRVDMIWGIVPLYFGLLLNETTSTKANFRTALQTGFSFLWAGAQWLWPYFRLRQPGEPQLELGAMLPVNLLVTFLVIALGVIALISGLRRKFPKHLRFIGHTRFANYFMITIFPIQAHYLPWTATRLGAIVLFAVPVWLVLHFGLMPIRNQK